MIRQLWPLFRPSWRQGAVALFEGAIAPVLVFYIAMWCGGAWRALWASMAWSVAVVCIRLVCSSRVNGLVVLTILTTGTRLAMAEWAHDPRWFFLQPLMSSAAIAFAMLLSVAIGYPLVHRLAGDFVPDTIMQHHWMRPFMRHITWLWATSTLVVSAISLWCWFRMSIDGYALAHTVLTWLIEGPTIGGFIWWFGRLARRHQLFPEPACDTVPPVALVREAA